MSLPVYAVSPMELLLKQEIVPIGSRLPVYVDIQIRSPAHATRRMRRRVGKALFQARNRFHITVHPVKIARFAGE